MNDDPLLSYQDSGALSSCMIRVAINVSGEGRLAKSTIGLQSMSYLDISNHPVEVVLRHAPIIFAKHIGE